MTTCAAIVRAAHEELNVTAMGREPTGPQAEFGMTRLSRLLASTSGMSIGEKLRDLAVNRDFTLPLNSRAVVTGLSAGIALTLPQHPQNGTRVEVIDAGNAFATHNVRISANVRLLEGANTSITAATNGYARTWMYRADLADWRAVSGLTLTDEFPYPEDVEDVFALMLAVRIAPRYGAALSDESKAALQRGLTSLRARYRQRIVAPIDSVFLVLSTQAYDGQICDVQYPCGVDGVDGDLVDAFDAGLDAFEDAL